jgi:four helix bundle protein
MLSYENLKVYKKAYALNQAVYRLLKANTSIPRYAKDQLGRASLSIVLNIAEGSAKFSNRDKKNFYTTARASVFECAALVSFLYDEQEISNDFKAEIIKTYDEVSRMLFAMIKNL